MPTEKKVLIYQFDELSAKAKEKARDWFRIDGELTGTAKHCAEDILKEHGDTCDSFKLAQAFLQERQALKDRLEDANENENIAWEVDEKISELEEEFKKNLLRDYLDTLQKEADYLTSDEAVDEAIRANEYTFLANGKRE